ncbi:MAG: ferritin-like domain-containing protein [Deltaproteobacteria bacterium]|nr:ferritin-like domain-containing protein [Deltaproteobacteria bacterium]
MVIERYLSQSDKIETRDIDWSEAKRIGLTEGERFILTYFSDIESQTIIYLRDLLHTKAIQDPDVVAFLSMWNYEEYFHGEALARLMAECGHPLEKERIAKVRKTAKVTEALESFGASLVSRIFREQFPALFMTWGAMNEITTLRGYEYLDEMTHNPVLKILCQRIAKQERRHFAWYYNSAKERLEKSASARRVTRMLMKLFWSPVGAGVKSNEEVVKLIVTLFPGAKGEAMSQDIDAKLSSLPGLEGLELMGGFIKKEVSCNHLIPLAG